METQLLVTSVRENNGALVVERRLFFLSESELVEFRKKTNWVKDEKGRFAGSVPTGGLGGNSGLTNSGNGDIIKSEIEKGNIKLDINFEKQARHIKGRPEYSDGKSYLTISENEAQKIIISKSGTGTLLKDKNGKPLKERIDCGRIIGVDVDKDIGKETPTDKATIHYSKTGTHLVPRKETNND